MELDLKLYGARVLDWLYDQQVAGAVGYVEYYVTSEHPPWPRPEWYGTERSILLADGTPIEDKMQRNYDQEAIRLGRPLTETEKYGVRQVNLLDESVILIPAPLNFSPFLIGLGLPTRIGRPICDHLGQHGWIEWSIESLYYVLDPQALVGCRPPSPGDELPDVMITSALCNFLASEYAPRDGRAAFTLQQLEGVAHNLRTNELITLNGGSHAKLAVIFAQLTTQGQDCIIAYGGNVRDYIDRSPSGPVTNIWVSDVTGNMINVNIDKPVQNGTTGMNTRDLLNFAGLVRQIAPPGPLALRQRPALPR